MSWDLRPFRLFVFSVWGLLVGQASGVVDDAALATALGALEEGLFSWAQFVDDSPVLAFGLVLLVLGVGQAMSFRKLAPGGPSVGLALALALSGALQWGIVLFAVGLALVVSPWEWAALMLGSWLWSRSRVPVASEGSAGPWVSLVLLVGLGWALPWLLRAFLFADAHVLPWYPGDCPPGPPILLFALLPLGVLASAVLVWSDLRSELPRCLRVVVLLLLVLIIGLGRGLPLGLEVGFASAGLLTLGLAVLVLAQRLGLPAFPQLSEGLVDGGVSWRCAGIAASASLALVLVADFQAAPDRDSPGVELVADHCSPAAGALGPGDLLALTEPDPPFVEVFPISRSEPEPFPLKGLAIEGLAPHLFATEEPGLFWGLLRGEAAEEGLGLLPDQSYPVRVEAMAGRMELGSQAIPCRVRGMVQESGSGDLIANCEGSHQLYRVDRNSGAVERGAELRFGDSLAPLGDSWDDVPGLWEVGGLLLSVHREGLGTWLVAADAKTGEIRAARSVGAGISDLRVSPDGEFLLAFRPSQSSILRLSLPGLEPLGNWRTSFGVATGAWVQVGDLQWLATASLFEPELSIRDSRTGEVALSRRLGAQVQSISVDVRGRLLLSSPAGTFRVSVSELFADRDQ